MDLAHILRELWKRKALVVCAAFLAFAIAVTATFRVSLLPPSIEKKDRQVGAASTQVLVDSPKSPVADLRRDFEAAEDRAAVYGPLMSSEPVKREIARRVGISPSQIITGGVSTESNDPEPETRANQIVGEDGLYRLSVTTPSETPLLSISAQGPSAEAAIKLANAAAVGLRDYIDGLQVEQAVPEQRRVKVRQLGEATGGIISSGTNVAIGLLAFIALLTGFCLLILFGSNVAASWRRADLAEHSGLGAAPNGHVPPELHSPLVTAPDHVTSRHAERH